MTVGAVDTAGRITLMQAVSWIAYGDFDASKKECITCDSLANKDEIEAIIVPFRKRILEAESLLLAKIRGGKLPVYAVPHGSNCDNLILIQPDKLEAVGIKLIATSNKILRYTKDGHPIQSSMWCDVEVRKDDILRLWPPLEILQEKADTPTHVQNASQTQEKAFELLNAEWGNKKIGRKEARDWFKKKGYPYTWGDKYIKHLLPDRKRKRGEHAKSKVAI